MKASIESCDVSAEEGVGRLHDNSPRRLSLSDNPMQSVPRCVAQHIGEGQSMLRSNFAVITCPGRTVGSDLPVVPKRLLQEVLADWARRVGILYA
jgi:hypothetical protein